ncbi:MAG: PspA/IM30 family protein [Gammaproteobacteria bacterium]
MALITRVSRLFQADFHAVLDRIEEPEVLLRQAVREMEEELASDEQRSRILKHEQGQLTAREIDLEQTLQELDEQLDICFDSGNDDLARASIKRKLETQQYCKGLARKRQALQETLDDLDTRLRENRSRLASMRQKAELLAEETARARPVDNWTIPDITVRDEDVEVALLREKQKRRRS